VLAWFQLRRYASPLAGSGSALGIDPAARRRAHRSACSPAPSSRCAILPASPVWPNGTSTARHWPATMFGMWQAGRRPHAGPVLLLSLAVA
jgi:hypothetical protein